MRIDRSPTPPVPGVHRPAGVRGSGQRRREAQTAGQPLLRERPGFPAASEWNGWTTPPLPLGTFVDEYV